jgi:16S rRNA (uracil1498-N3)-methyltransferase
MITLLAPAGALAAGTVLEPEDREAHHLRVRRSAAGEPVRVVDGAGNVAEGRLTSEGKSLRVTVEAVVRIPAPPRVALAVGAGDKDRFAFIVEKAVELGASAVIPLETERTRDVATRLRPGHLGRLRRRALEALKQSGAAWAPEVREILGVEEFVHQLSGNDGPRWLAEPEGQPPARLRTGDPLTIAVGPEGGFTSIERKRFLEAAFLPARVGPHLLRFETAALSALALAWWARQGNDP